MNFLAHAFLAGSDPAMRVGGMFGDFVKGPLPAGLPMDLAAGVALHRRIDSFTDAHLVFRRSRARVGPGRRRCAGIMVDVFYDHFLAVHWNVFHQQSLAQFTAETYAMMAMYEAWMPDRLARIFPRMRDDDWLASYREIGAIHTALDSMARRLSRPDMLIGAAEELERFYRDFEKDFLDFLPEAVSRFRAGGSESGQLEHCF